VFDRAGAAANANVDVVLDVGANEGLFAKRLRESGHAGRIISFEPLSTPFTKLREACAADPGWECVRVAVGANRGTAHINVSANWASSSLLELEERTVAVQPRVRYVGTEECEVATLDDFRGALFDATDRIYLKLDVQGYELEALRGAEATLGQVEVLDVELSLVPLYTGGPLKDEVTDYLARRGFELLAAEPSFLDSRNGEVLQVDGLFLRRA